MSRFWLGTLSSLLRIPHPPRSTPEPLHFIILVSACAGAFVVPLFHSIISSCYHTELSFGYLLARIAQLEAVLTVMVDLLGFNGRGSGSS